jgi:hypothetical protein
MGNGTTQREVRMEDLAYYVNPEALKYFCHKVSHVDKRVEMYQSWYRWYSYLYSSPNRFRFMGNGTTQREVRMEDLAYYVK